MTYRELLRRLIDLKALAMPPEPGEVPPLNFSELSLRLSRGRNSFIPIPYQRSCRVELAPGWGAYYHFTYTRFPDGTQMPAYEERFSREGCVALAELDRTLYARGETDISGETRICEAEIMPGEEAMLCEKTGCGALAELAVDAARFAPRGDRWPDWPLLVTGGGPGRFVGVHLNILCTWPRPAQEASTWWVGQWDKKTVDWWWGEGDEKFFVDGEAFPSTFGTGSEDYIGYAWAAEPPFALFDSSFAAMNAMPLDGNGKTSVMRFHVADNIPFQKRFEGFIEKYKADEWGEGGVCRYCAVPYWYES